MSYTNEEIMQIGYNALEKAMGVADTQRFIANINSDHFDYTEWRHAYFDNIPPEELEKDILEFARTHQPSFTNRASK